MGRAVMRVNIRNLKKVLTDLRREKAITERFLFSILLLVFAMIIAFLS
jgi:hypothetical protein